MCFHLRNSIWNLIYNILKYSIMGNVVMLGFSLMIVKSNMRYEGYENHMWKICIFVSKHGAYPAMWSLVNIHLSSVSKPQMAKADL